MVAVAEETQLGAVALDLPLVVGPRTGGDGRTVGPWWRVIRVAIMFGVLAVVAGLVISEHTRLANTGHALTSIDWKWIVAAAVAEALSMTAFALVHRRLLKVGDTRMSVRTVTAVAYASNAISSSIPLAGSEIGTAYTFRQFEHRGADRVTAGWVLVVSGVAASITFAVIVSVAAVGSGDEWAVLGGAAGSILLASGFGVLVWVTRRPRLQEFLVGLCVRVVATVCRLIRQTAVDPERTVKRVLERVSTLRLSVDDWIAILWWSIVNWLADALCLAIALSALHSELRWSALILAWAAGATVSSFQLTPGGLGVVEASVISALVLAGAPVGGATAAVLLYRLVSYWMVVLAGWMVFVIQRHGTEVSSRILSDA